MNNGNNALEISIKNLNHQNLATTTSVTVTVTITITTSFSFCSLAFSTRRFLLKFSSTREWKVGRIINNQTVHDNDR